MTSQTQIHKNNSSMKWPLAPPFINKLNTISAHASRNMINRCYHKEWAGVLVGMG